MMMMAEGFETPTGANSGLQFGSSANEGASFATPGGVCGGLRGGGRERKREWSVLCILNLGVGRT